MGVTCPITYDPVLIETIVRRRVDMASREDKGWTAEYRAELDDIYEMPEKSRESVFAALDRRYFQRIGIPAVVEECLAERAASLSAAASVSLLNSRNKSEEGVDVTRDRQLVIRFRPSTLENMEIFRHRLRRELIQAADCLNPAFGHAPEILEQMLPSEKERIREAMSILWAQSAENRLTGREDPGHPRTFREMVDFCRSRLGSEKVSAGICDLCRFPSEDVVSFSELSSGIRIALKAEFSELRDMSPVCVRCVERQDFVLHQSPKNHLNGASS